MSSADLPVPAGAAGSRGARRLFVFRAVLLGWVVLDAVSWRVVGWNQSSETLLALQKVITPIWLALLGVEIALVNGLRREVVAHPAAGLLGAATAVLWAELGLSAIPLLHTLGGPDLLPSGEDGWIRLVLFGVVALGFDLLFWRALERLHGRVAAVWRMGFYVVRVASAVLPALTFLAYAAYPVVPLGRIFTVVMDWLRLPLTIAWPVPVLVVLRDLARHAPAAAGADTPAPPAVSDAQRDLTVGAIWLAGGLLLTLGSYGAALGGATLARYFITYGPILYGLVRVVRGLSRSGRG